MSYRETFISKSKDIFEEQLKLSQAQQKAYNLIGNYFKYIFDSLRAEEEVSNRDISFGIHESSWSISLKNTSLKVIYKKEQITVKIRPVGLGYNDTIDLEEYPYIYKSKKFRKELSEELLDLYLKEAFDSLLKQI